MFSFLLCLFNCVGTLNIKGRYQKENDFRNGSEKVLGFFSGCFQGSYLFTTELAICFTGGSQLRGEDWSVR